MTTRILVVDDLPDTLLTLSALLRHYGYEVATASSVSEALPMLPHVQSLVCDGLEGQCWPLVERARELGVRTVILTGSVEIRRMAVELGHVVLSKPVGIQKVLEAIGESVTVPR